MSIKPLDPTGRGRTGAESPVPDPISRADGRVAPTLHADVACTSHERRVGVGPQGIEYVAAARRFAEAFGVPAAPTNSGQDLPAWDRRHVAATLELEAALRALPVVVGFTAVNIG